MLIDARVKTTVPIDIESDEAFRILCKTLSMDCVLDEDHYYRVEKTTDGLSWLYRFVDGVWEFYDDRGDLFLALRNVAVMMFPNLLFR